MSACKKLTLFIIGLFISSQAYAGTISVNTISNDSVAATFNSNFSTLTNVINGNIEGSGATGVTLNIKADSLGELDMADEINPRVRDSELLSNTVDTTTSQRAYVYTGLTPAVDVASLTTNVSAGTAYINGYRVNKSATSQTYTASMDTYLDLSQTGVFTQSAVSIGATAPTVAANSARLAKVTTDGTGVTSVTDLANRRIPGLIIPTNYRSGLIISRDSTSGIVVYPGSVEINNAMVAKTTSTTLGLGTAGDWAGGSSLRNTSTYGYVGIDASGNIDMHTTAPTHDNYAVSSTVGTKRYATWSSTVYRILGWFYMNATGSGEIEFYSLGNIREGEAPNAGTRSANDQVTYTTTTLAALDSCTLNIYSSGKPVTVSAFVRGIGSSNNVVQEYCFSADGVTVDSSTRYANKANSNSDAESLWEQQNINGITLNLPQGTHTIELKAKTASGTGYARKRYVSFSEA